ncbi:tRNA 2'-phosphotransferase 1-like isoform X3 [Homalodisca vitripennis]|uniref:tRNA 2'-phosphotransferase 1-like isoform X1 n=1 Tax=Homalodisca vitripennis TaxID=197043 RepID=UPI001EEA93E7|nr:tRNA 2'-phosphotransferase 1-like isoform X1 [Homalodisca vitripennis]XP_046683864.1 tRNA 2'-phosphotransferase 1-like isoform X2 [Homalodisca vitripennis]XP_046683870.1 tRNA 2'-phosphotransferase 1-like isoform X3 [Homalodisca vitripennis]
MDPSKKVQTSKALSWLLRHGAVQERLQIGSDGFVSIEQILQHQRFRGKCTLMDIEDIVRTDKKIRFTLQTNKETGKLEIRANQGHSITNLDGLELEPIRSSAELPNGWAVHGTYHSVLPNIRLQGLSRMSRVHIHLSPHEPGDHRIISGLRPNVQVLVYVDVDKAILGGISFFKSANDVILSEGNSSGLIEPKYFLKIKDIRTGENLL